MTDKIVQHYTGTEVRELASYYNLSVDVKTLLFMEWQIDTITHLILILRKDSDMKRITKVSKCCGIILKKYLQFVNSDKAFMGRIMQDIGVEPNGEHSTYQKDEARIFYQQANDNEDELSPVNLQEVPVIPTTDDQKKFVIETISKILEPFTQGNPANKILQKKIKKVTSLVGDIIPSEKKSGASKRSNHTDKLTIRKVMPVSTYGTDGWQQIPNHPYFVGKFYDSHKARNKDLKFRAVRRHINYPFCNTTHSSSASTSDIFRCTKKNCVHFTKIRSEKLTCSPTPKVEYQLFYFGNHNHSVSSF